MIASEVQLRVRYSETDKMGYAYYGNYATYLEVARVELMREYGIRYLDLENAGIIMPVLDLKSKYIRPAKYDDLLTIKVSVKKKPAARIVFEYEIFNEENVLLNVSETTLVFVDLKTGKPTLPPEALEEAIGKYFKNEKS